MKQKIINEICREKGIEKEDISYDWISILKKDGIEKKIINNKFQLNSVGSSELALDKYSTYEILNYYKIPIIHHDVIFNEKLIPGCEHINNDLKILKNSDKQVIKANGSSQGRDVYVLENEQEKIEVVNKLFEKEVQSVVVCPYMEIEYEYRALFLYGEIIYIYKKEKPFVVGDGKSTVKELIETNLKYLTEPDADLDSEYVPAKGEKLTVAWKHNLSNGAVPIIIDENDEYYEQIKKIAINAGNVMELNFASVDVVVTNDKQVLVMEVNSNVTVSKFCELVPNGYEIGKEIYAKVIDKMFEKGEYK